MKKIIQIALTALVCIAMVSCDNNIDGKASDSIKLSKSKLTFDSTGGVETISTKGNSWWFTSFKVDNIYVFTPFEKEIDRLDKNFEFTGEWYHIKRTDRLIEISVLENETEKPRKLIIGLQDGNWFGSTIFVNQK